MRSAKKEMSSVGALEKAMKKLNFEGTPEDKARYFYKVIIPRLQKKDNKECHLCLAEQWQIPGIPMEVLRHTCGDD